MRLISLAFILFILTSCDRLPWVDAKSKFVEKFKEYITEKINMLDTHRVPIIVENDLKGKDYCGLKPKLPITPIGLDEGIKRVFQKLKREYISKGYIFLL